MKFMFSIFFLALVALPYCGGTSLHEAVSDGNVEEVKRLVTEETVNEVADFGKTPLHYAAQKDNVDIVETLLGHEAKVNEKDKYGETPLHYAVEYKNVDIVKILVEHGAKVNEKDILHK